jgi:hypothetical protein
MNKFKNKWIFIIAILVIILGIVIFNNKDDISEMIGINSKETYESNTTNSFWTSEVCYKKDTGNKNILAAYEYNDTVSSLNVGYCVNGTESTCVKSNCINSASIGACPAGTIIKYQVNDEKIMYFNVLHDDGGVMTLQSVVAITQSAWNSSNDATQGPVTALTAITDATKEWSNVNDLNYSLGETVFLKYPNNSTNSTPYTFCLTNYTCISNYYKLSSSLTTGVKSRIISFQEAVDLGCTLDSYTCPNWMLTDKTSYFTSSIDNIRTHPWYISSESNFIDYYMYVSPSTILNIKAVIEIIK